MALNFAFDTAASTPCRISFAIDGSDAAAITVSNTALRAACVDGPLKDFLNKSLTGPADGQKNLRITLVVAGISPAGVDANIPNWALNVAGDGSNKVTLVVSQNKTPATGGATFTAYGWVEFVHSLVR